ncbi:hypothetical protein CYMTET_4646 [Cymbomonas tetramitiformis]|uniref:Telomerase reverse transcriptase n=1 Tax=Cymbomonas tetramitiformis TaxID=36881 RepID=A0AAE0LJV7_9CHLO|nr:hypothetical protein CYMTET_4646 [Cymbomonas tetramitiformis]
MARDKKTSEPIDCNNAANLADLWCSDKHKFNSAYLLSDEFLNHLYQRAGSAISGESAVPRVDGPAGLGARGQSAQAHCAASALIGRWMYWILAGLVVPLLRAHFYVTETEPYRQRLFYYRKPVWRDITRRAQRGLFRSTDTDLRPAAPAPSSSPSQWAEGPSAALPGDAAQPAASLGQYAFPPRRVVEALLRAPGRRLGFSVVRLVPRRDGVRPIANLSRSSSLPARPVPQGAGRAGDAGHGGARWARPPGRGGVTRSAPQGGIGAGGRWFVPVNRALSAPYLALRYECRSRRSELLGASVHGVEDAYHRLREYIMRWRQSQKDASQGGVSQGVGAGDEAGPFLATWDVAKCFDSIPIPRLWEVIKPILQHPHYQVVQGSNCTSQPGLTGHAMRFVRAMPSRDYGVQVKFDRTVVPTALWGGFQRFSSALPTARRHTVFVDQAKSQGYARQELLEVLHEHLHVNVIKVGTEFLVQRIGIAQGSVLSTLLCGCFYAHMEASLMPSTRVPKPISPLSSSGLTGASMADAEEGDLASLVTQEDVPWPGSGTPVAPAEVNRHAPEEAEQEVSEEVRAVDQAGLEAGADSLLLRLTDDFLMIGSQRAPVERTLCRLLPGVPEYGCVVNPLKTSLNFALRAGAMKLQEQQNLYRAPHGASFIKWIGLLINSETLEIQSDYTRYCGQDLSDSLTAPLGQKGETLPLKLCHYIRPKCYAMLFDGAINSSETVKLNIYQIFLLCGMKLHCHIVHMKGCGPEHNPEFFLRAIHTAVAYAARHIRARVPQDTAAGPSSRLPARCHVYWLGLHAFQVVLTRKQTRWRAVLELLHHNLQNVMFRGCAQRFASIVDPTRSAVFREIRF